MKVDTNKESPNYATIKGKNENTILIIYFSYMKLFYCNPLDY